MMAKTHLDTEGQPLQLKRTGKLVPFLEVSIGQPFWAHGKVWVRTSHDAATQLGSTSQRRYGFVFWQSCCNFCIDPIDIEVEALQYGDVDENDASVWRIPVGD